MRVIHESDEFARMLEAAIARDSGIRVLGANGSSFPRRLQHHRNIADVTLLGLRMRGLDAIDVVAQIKRTRSTAAVVMFAHLEADEWSEMGFATGADAIIRWDTPIEAMRVVTRTLGSGRDAEALIAELGPHLLWPRADSSRRPLTPRPRLGSDSRKVLEMLCASMTCEEIAIRRCQPMSSVQRLLHRLRERFGVHDNAQLVLAAIRYGYVVPR